MVLEGGRCSSHSKAISWRGTDSAAQPGEEDALQKLGEGGLEHISPSPCSWWQGNISSYSPCLTCSGELTPLERGGVHGKVYTASAGDLAALGRVLLLLSWLRQEQSPKCHSWQRAGIQGKPCSWRHPELAGWGCCLQAGPCSSKTILGMEG